MKDNSDTQWKMRLQLRHNEYCSCSYTVPSSDQNVPGSDVPSSDLLRVAIRYYWKEEYARILIHNGSSKQIENSASLVMPNSYLVTEFSISTSQPLKIFIS